MMARLITRVAGLILAVLIVLACVNVVRLTVGTPFETVDDFLFRWMSPLAPALATVVIVARALTSNRPSTGWLLIAAGQAFWSGGAFYYAIVLWYADPMPFPSLADASWLAFYPPTLAGVVLLIRARAAGRGDTVSLLDAAIGGLAISAAGAALAFGPIVDATGGSTLAIATNLAFPLADLAIVAVLVGGLAMSGWRLGRCWTLLGAGFVLFAVSDTTYLFQIANGTYTAASSKRGGCAPARSWRSPSGSRGRSHVSEFRPGVRSFSRLPSARLGCACSSMPPSTRFIGSRSCLRQRVWSV